MKTFLAMPKGITPAQLCAQCESWGIKNPKIRKDKPCVEFLGTEQDAAMVRNKYSVLSVEEDRGLYRGLAETGTPVTDGPLGADRQP